MLGCCIFISLFAYLCLAKALECWQASRVSAVLALIPLFSVVAEKTGSILFPDIIIAENINGLAVFGAVILIAGSMITAMYSE